MHTEDEDGKPGPDLLQLLQDVQPASAAQREIEHHNVPRLLRDKLERLCRCGRLTKHDRAGLRIEKALDAVSYDFMVIDDEKLGHAGSFQSHVIRKRDAYGDKRSLLMGRS